jgi:peptidoglycan hydrolase-like protein with peptidoglycan-binding domain
MKAVMPLALLGALAVGTAYAAGTSGSSSDDTSGWSSQSSSSSSHKHSQHMSHSQIKQIQGKLKEQGYDVGSVDGKLGKSTQQAIRQFQEDKGLTASGKPDQQTMAALNSAGGTQQGQLPPGSRGGTSGGSSGGMSGGGGNSGGGMPGGPSGGGESGNDMGTQQQGR